MTSSLSSAEPAGANSSLTTSAQAEPPRRGRRAPKVKTGCITCKIRKVKCDEGRPECRQCMKTGRKCDGYLSVTNTRTEVPTQGTSFLPTLRNALDYLPVRSQEEAWFLHVYRHRVVQVIHSYPTGNSVYASAALCLAYSDTVMRAATVALAMGFERYNAAAECTGPVTPLLTHYNSALRGMHQKLEPLARGTKLSPEGWSVLLCTMLQLTGVELFAGNVPGALLHLSHIMRLLKQHDLDRLRVHQENGTFDELCRQLYLNLRSFPIPGLFTHVTPAERALAKHIAGDFPIEFLAERDAVMAWYDLLEDYTDLTQWLISSELPRNVADDVAIERMLIRAQRWLDAVLDFSSRLRNHSNHYWPPEQGAIFSTNVRAMMLQLKVLRCGSCESHYDQFHADMKTIMRDAQALSGYRRRENGPWCRRSIAASVFYVAIKCRDPLLRREAADWLFTWNGWHGPWYGRAMASTIARRIIEVEEKGLVFQSALDVPVHSRVRDLHITVGKHHERRAVVRYRVGQLGTISPVRQEQIVW